MAAAGPRPSRPSRDDSPLARRLKSAVAASDLRNLKRLEEAAGLSLGSVVIFATNPLRQSPRRRLEVMKAVETYLAIPVAEVAALAGLLPSGEVPGAGTAGKIEGLTDRQATAAATFRTLVGRRPWPGLEPDPIIWPTWPAPLRQAWKALRAADAVFAAEHPRAQFPSFAVWRLVVSGDVPGWSRRDNFDNGLARLERAALAAGLDALAALLVPVTDGQVAHASPEPVAVPETGARKTPVNPPFPQSWGIGSPDRADQPQSPDSATGIPQNRGKGVADMAIPQSPVPVTGSRQKWRKPDDLHVSGFCQNRQQHCSPELASKDFMGLSRNGEKPPPAKPPAPADLNCQNGNAPLHGRIIHAGARRGIRP